MSSMRCILCHPARVYYHGRHFRRIGVTKLDTSCRFGLEVAGRRHEIIIRYLQSPARKVGDMGSEVPFSGSTFRSGGPDSEGDATALAEWCKRVRG